MTEKSENAAISGGERILAGIAVTVAVISFVALLTVLLAPVFGVDFATNTSWVWPVALQIAYWGFPLALLLVIVVIIWRVISNRTARNK